MGRRVGRTARNATKAVCGDAPLLFGRFGLLESWLPTRVYPVEVLHHLLGSKDELHVLASSSKQQAASSSKQQQQAVKKSLRPRCGSTLPSKELKLTAEQSRITTNRFGAVSSRLACSMVDLVSKNGRLSAVFRTIVLKTQDNRWFVQYLPHCGSKPASK